MISGRDIVLISSIEWDLLWQHPQEIATRFSRAGNRVLYVENMGVRSLTLRDAGRVFRRIASWTKSLGSHGVRPVGPHLSVCSPLILPPFGPTWRRYVNRRVLLPIVHRSAQNLGIHDPLIWIHLPTDSALELVRFFRTPRSTVVYYCIADFARLTPYASEIRQSEEQIVKESDLVLANSSRLADHCRQWRTDVHVSPPGVNLDAFPRDFKKDDGATRKELERLWEARNIRSVRRSPLDPIIGYVGGLHRHVAFRLVEEMARARPHWLWVFIGPKQTRLGRLATLPNVLLLGHRPHGELARYIRSFDVCIAPYLDNPETATVVPVKINEYLAAGKPVVCTELSSILEQRQWHDVLTKAAARPEIFLSAIEEALRSPNGEVAIARRRQVAELADWDRRLQAMADLIEDRDKAVETSTGTR